MLLQGYIIKNTLCEDGIICFKTSSCYQHCNFVLSTSSLCCHGNPHLSCKIILTIIIISGLSRKPHRSTRLLQPTDRLQYSGIIRSVHSINVGFLNQIRYFSMKQVPVVLTWLSGPRSRTNQFLKLWKFRESNPRPHGY